MTTAATDPVVRRAMDQCPCLVDGGGGGGGGGVVMVVVVVMVRTKTMSA